jgi:hypothetical protein
VDYESFWPRIDALAAHHGVPTLLVTAGLKCVGVLGAG